jgi:hypothetical protein
VPKQIKSSQACKNLCISSGVNFSSFTLDL